VQELFTIPWTGQRLNYQRYPRVSIVSIVYSVLVSQCRGITLAAGPGRVGLFLHGKVAAGLNIELSH
jgi:hypothetical protein